MGITNIQEQIEALTVKLGELALQQRNMSRQILALTDELEKLKQQAGAEKSVAQPAPTPIPTPQPTLKPPPAPRPTPVKNTTVEEFIGGNLTSKVGILITIIGIFIGAKYAIEHNLVNPVVRVISGYISGLVLIGVAIRLRKKYEQYSSVLMGGGLAVLYFITYIAYSFYGMLPQLAAFGLMLLFTIGTVYTALLYNRIIIAHLGLVGAYAIPILLSDNSGRFAVLFTYIAIINAGILVLSLKKYWKSLFYVSFVLTWMIYSSWFAFQYRAADHFNIAFIFVSIYFLIFYITFLAYKLIKKEQYAISDVALLLSNAFMFYGFGYAILDGNPNTDHLLGVFTLINAVIHLVIGLVIRRLKLADQALFYLLLGLVIAFITIAVPVQLDGSWVTLLWTVEAVLVFYIGRTQQRTSYEKLGISLITLSFISLVIDWMNHTPYVDNDPSRVPFFNIVVVTGLFVSISQAIILYIHQKKNAENINKASMYLQFYDYALPTLFLLTTFFVFQLEIEAYFDRIHSKNGPFFLEEIAGIEVSTTLLYTLIFTALLLFINERRIKNRVLSIAGLFIAGFSIAALMTDALPRLNTLSVHYFTHNRTYFGVWILLMRYLLIGTVAVLLVLSGRTIKNVIKNKTLVWAFTVFTQVAILAILSFEYLNWTGLNNTGNEYKLGLSILWSVYALGLVILGINKKKRHWRLTGICFFIVTLIKLFLYDLNQTTTISKTLSFISLGAILLLVSYLYNRYKHVILAEDEEEQQ